MESSRFFLEPGATINHPPLPHSYISYTTVCTPLIYPGVNCSVGIREEDTNQPFLKLYPNPTDGMLS